MADLFEQAETLQKDYGSRLPPVDKWNPPLSGDIDIRIARDGSWYHEGEAIQRLPLVKLFASILKREGDDYFLVTPVEKWRIQVEDTAFVVVDFSRRGEDADQELAFKTNTGDIVVADQAHPLWVEGNTSGSGAEESVPYIMVRDNLPARINRNVYYHLIDLALGEGDRSGDVLNQIEIRSAGHSFRLG